MCLCVCEIQQIVFDSQLLALMHHHFYCINNSKLLPTIDINFPLLSLCASVESLLQHQSSFPHFFGFWWLKTTVRTNKAPWPQAPVQLLFCLLLNTLCRYFAEHFYLKLWLLCWTGELVIKVTPKTREGREGFNPQFLYPRRIHLLLSFSDACVAQALIILSLWLLILF